MEGQDPNDDFHMLQWLSPRIRSFPGMQRQIYEAVQEFGRPIRNGGSQGFGGGTSFGGPESRRGPSMSRFGSRSRF